MPVDILTKSKSTRQNKIFRIFISMNTSVKKQAVLSMVNEMPNEFSIDEMLDKLILLQKIELGQQDVEAGRVKSEEDAKKQLNKWLE
jgi:hypothetical protein